VEGQLDLVFDLAVRYRAGIDIHLHDGGELGIFELGKIAERCRTHGPCRAGNPADLFVFRAASVQEAVVTHAPRDLVIKGGRIGQKGLGA